MKRQDIQVRWIQQRLASFLCLFGKGTKISKYLIEHDKIKFGIKTDTGDREGKIVEEKETKIDNLEEKKVDMVLQKFKGKQIQIPPMYSAIKVNRKKTI